MPQKLTILQTTDIHCQLHPHDELFWEDGQAVFRQCGGYPQLATRLKQIKEQSEYSFILDTGDMFQGSMLSMLTEGKAMVPVLNAMPYDLLMPGNWEVLYGKDALLRLIKSLRVPVVCANMHHDNMGLPGELLFKPYHIWDAGGFRVGFLGYTDPLVPIRQSPDYSKGIVFSQPEKTLPYYVKELREQKGCDAVIVLGHLGLSQQIALANSEAAEGVDYILGGDTHERVRKPIKGKFTSVVEPGAFGSFIGKLDLTVSGKRITRRTYHLIEMKSEKVKPEPDVLAAVTRVEKPYKKRIDTVLGYATKPLYRYFVIENPIDTLVTDALAWKFPKIDVVLSNGFRFCPPNATPNADGLYPITQGYLFDMLPVDSNVRTGKVTGAQLRQWLEKELNNVFAAEASKRFGGWMVKFKGMQVRFNAFGDEGQRLQSVKVRGKALKDEQVYSVLACEREGDPPDMLCRLKDVASPKDHSVSLHEAVTEFLAANSPIDPTPRKDAIALDAPATLLTQVTGVDYEFK